MPYTKYYKNMSISAEISKKVVFSSIEEFWNYLKPRNPIKTSSVEFVTFYDTIYLAKYGCPCNTDELNGQATDMYRQFNKIEPNIWNLVKSDIGCNNIIFKLSEEFLFEL
jgi:hypothetical protein